MEELLPFIDSLLKEKNLSGMSPEVYGQLRKDLANELKLQIDRAIITEFSEEQADAFSGLLDNQDTTDESLQEFVQKSGIDTSKVVAHTMVKFREFYLGASDKD